MKCLLTFVSIILVAYALSTTAGSRHYITQTEISYRVYKIDSINSFYLIYAKGRDSLFKIVSKKESDIIGNKIEVDKAYSFKLHSSLTDFRIGNVLISPRNLEVNCFSYYDETQICYEGDSIRDLFHADNLRGLYFIKTK